jgi:hypothetical protein
MIQWEGFTPIFQKKDLGNNSTPKFHESRGNIMDTCTDGVIDEPSSVPLFGPIELLESPISRH